MSGSPFIKRAKSRSNIRQRDSPGDVTGSPLASSVTASQDQGVEEDEQIFSPMAMAKARKKEKEKKKSGLGGSGKARLSFGGDGEDADAEVKEFVPRKSTLSQSMSLQKLAAENSTGLSSPAGPSRQVSSTTASSPSYSTAYLNELKAATPTRLTGRSRLDAEIDGDEDEDMDMDGGLSLAARQKYGDVSMVDTTAGIPDEAHVAAAKAKRRAAVGQGGVQGGEEDFIPLNEGKGRMSLYDGDKGPHPESRLQREEDEEGDGDDDLAEFTGANERLSLGKTANRIAARRLKNELVEMIDDVENQDLDDEDEREWATAQAARANPYKTPDVTNRAAAKAIYTPAMAPAASPLPTISAASARLQSALQNKEISSMERTRQIATTEKDLAGYEIQELELRQEVALVEAKKEWMEEFRGWIETLGGFLEEKFPLLEDIEADTNHHYSERDTIVSKRRMQDDEDDLALFLGVPAPQSDGTNEEEQVDELGRVHSKVDESGPQSGTRRHRRQDREARRMRRRATRPSQEEDGYSTDSSLGEADAADYNDAQETLLQRAKALSADVEAEDFRDPVSGLAQRFGGWREKYTEEYTNAYGGLAIVQAWEYWARSEMVGWEPTRDSKSLDAFKWYHSIHQYSRPRIADDDNDDEMEEPELGPDGDLVPPLVSAAVIPIIVNAFESGAYDVYSTKQTRRVLDLVDLVSVYTGKENAKFRTILKAVILLFLKHIDSTAELVRSSYGPAAAPPPAFDPASRTALATFIHRRMKILRNLLFWRLFAGKESAALILKLVSDVLLPCLTKCWDSGGQELSEQIVKLIPAGFLPEDVSARLQLGPYFR